VTVMVYGMLALVVMALVIVARGSGRDPASRGATIEYAIVMAVAVLFSPLAWKHYFVFLLLGYIVLWQALTDPTTPALDRRRIGWMLLGSFALTTLLVRGIVGRTASRMLETYSVITLGALLALAALLYLRTRVATRER
jgi:hypothetical protein